MNRFRDSYADKVDVAHTAKEEPEERQMTDLQLARRVSEVREKLQQQRAQQQADAWQRVGPGPQLW